MRQASPPAKFLFYISVVILSVSCITVFVTNLIMWTFLSRRPSLSYRRNGVRAQERRLIVTLLIVTLISLSAWLPFTIINVVNNIKPLSLTSTIICASKLLHHGNSCANVFVYTRRIAEFRKTFKKISRSYSPFTDYTEAAVIPRTRILGFSRKTTAIRAVGLALKLLKKNVTT